MGDRLRDGLTDWLTDWSWVTDCMYDTMWVGGVGCGGGKRYGMTAGGQVREQELVASLQMLLEKVHIGQFATEPDNK